MLIKKNHPGITQIGEVRFVAMQTRISGWTLTYCTARCACHVNPTTLDLAVENGRNGSLGLRKFRACYCCEPWTWQELAWIGRELRAITAMTTSEGQPS